jgi:arabinan endo-1,5-alpha-L-arabinosidase
MNVIHDVKSLIAHRGRHFGALPFLARAVRFPRDSVPGWGLRFCFLTAAIFSLGLPALALDGQIGIHDPTTIMICNGKYYTYGTGGSALVSDDGWTWRSGTRPPRGGMGPDCIHVGENYFMFTAGNIGGQPRAAVNVMSTKSLDPNSPDYGWEDGGQVAGSDGVEFCNAIDPAGFYDPNDGKLWLSYGSYFGYIRLVELNPETGQRVDPDSTPFDLAINCEASDIIFHDGWYYLLATHGSCCNGAASGYNIRVGRSKKVTGPYLDHEGVDMIQGGGKLFLGSSGRVIGAGHFGLLDLGDGVQMFSQHWEADLDRGGASVLGLTPLLWEDGWPVAGENFKEGTYRIESVRTGTALELAVQGVTVGSGGRGGMGGGRGGMGGGGRGGRGGAAPAGAPGGAAANTAMVYLTGGMGGGGMFGGRGGVVADQDVEVVSANWPEGDIDVRMANYLCQAQQKWTVTPVADAGGYPGSPYFKITIAGTDRALAMSDDLELVTLPAFTGGDEQLWRIDQLADGTRRIMPKSASVAGESLAISAIGASFATLEKYNPDSLKQRWSFKTP